MKRLVLAPRADSAPLTATVSPLRARDGADHIDVTVPHDCRAGACTP